jgi:hypothetical protein
MTGNVGKLVRISLTNDDNGREVLRAYVDFERNGGPDLPFSVVWNGSPVRIVLADDKQEGAALAK